MPFVVGGFASLVALAAGILGQVDPLTSLGRAAIVFVLGWIGANLWYVLTTFGRQPIPETDVEQTPVGEPEPS